MGWSGVGLGRVVWDAVGGVPQCVRGWSTGLSVRGNRMFICSEYRECIYYVMCWIGRGGVGCNVTIMSVIIITLVK